MCIITSAHSPQIAIRQGLKVPDDRVTHVEMGHFSVSLMPMRCIVPLCCKKMLRAPLQALLQHIIKAVGRQFAQIGDIGIRRHFSQHAAGIIPNAIGITP